MSLKIKAHTLLTKHYLEVDSGGVQYYNGTGFGSVKRFTFDQIACVLVSPANQLSFQVDKEVFSIEINPDDAVHKTVINVLLQEIQRTTTT